MISILKKIFTFFFFIILFIFYSYSQAIFYIKNNGQVLKSSNITRFFTETPNNIRTQVFNTDPLLLQKAAKYALSFFERRNVSFILKPAIYNENLLTVAQVKNTLRFIINVIENDKKNKRNYRILNSNFLNRYFKFLRWKPDHITALHNKHKLIKGRIRLTNYATFQVTGAYRRNKWYPYALYSIVNSDFKKRGRFRLTKQQVYSGILNHSRYKRKVRPLVWLSKKGVEEALMQGSIKVRMPNRKIRTFSVDSHNGYEYDKRKKPLEQKRYWYFKEINNRYRTRINNRGIAGIQDFGGVVFAGDINNIGFGKIIVIRYKNNITNKIEMRLGILADTGGAFVNNIYQLDYYAGIFNSKWSFDNWRKGLPDNVEAYILVKK